VPEYNLLAPIDGVLYASDRHAEFLGKSLEGHAIDHVPFDQLSVSFGISLINDPLVNNRF